MAQNMAVSVTLRLEDRFTSPVRDLLRTFQQLGHAAQEFNRHISGSGATNHFARVTRDARALASEVRALASHYTQLGRAMAPPTSSSFLQRQVADMRTLISLQQQAIANNARMIAGPAGPSGLRTAGAGLTGGGRGVWGRAGFSPNASLADRFQHRFVGVGERSLIEGALDLDRVRTQLSMLANPRPDPNNPNATLPGVITPQVVAEAERLSIELSRGFRVLNRAHILDTFREIVTQFENVEDAFRLLPELLNVQEWHVLMGDNLDQARQGMLSLLRAIGLSGRLINNAGRLSIVDPNNPNSPIQASEFLDAYLRARMIGGRDVTLDQVFQLMKYLKASGQSLDANSLLTAFIAMPDIRGSTFGNQLNMMIRTITGGGTQASLQALARIGLGTVTDRTASGPHGFQLVDEELLRANPFAWFDRHVTGAQGFLGRAGIDINNPNTSMAQIQTAMRQAFGSNQSAFNMALMIVGQYREWLSQVRNALRLNLTPEARVDSARWSDWYQLQTLRSALMDVLGAIVANFKVLNPVLESVADSMKTFATWIDPRTGNTPMSFGILGGGAALGFFALRNMWRGMGPWGRALLGGGAGFFLGGGSPSAALMGALMAHQILRGRTAALVAGTAGAAAGAAWGGRFMTAVRWILGGLRGLFVWGAVGYLLDQIVANWESVKTRLMAIWEELRQAAPVWVGGEGRGWRTIGSGEGTRGLREDARTLFGPGLDSLGLGGLADRLFPNRQEMLRLWGFNEAAIATLERHRADRALAAWEYHGPLGPGRDAMAGLAHRIERIGRGEGFVASGARSITTGPINVTVNVTTGADPNAIGNATRSAVRDQLRRLLGDSADTVPQGGH